MPVCYTIGSKCRQLAGYSDDTERYYLEYRTAGDDRVRDSHAALNGIVLPKRRPFWQKYYTPNGWRCRCHVVEVLASSNTKAIVSKLLPKEKRHNGNR
uniref:Phage head morphogenesis domain-containing protein n=1 Tax=Flavobacterium columnare TaxID=996 RepID=A0AA94F0J5_9FLAO